MGKKIKKCWRRIKKSPNDAWIDKKRDIVVVVAKNPAYPMRKGYEVDIDKGMGKVKTHGKMDRWSKPRALKFAKRYMKKHNVC